MKESRLLEELSSLLDSLVRMVLNKDSRNVEKRSVLYSRSTDSKPGTGRKMDHCMHTRPVKDLDSNQSSRDYTTGSVKGSHI